MSKFKILTQTLNKITHKVIFTNLLILQLLLVSDTQAQSNKILRIYTYDSFVADWGPGPKIKEGFEKQCGCEVKFTSFSEAATLLSRLILEGTESKADIILGLDSTQILKANNTKLFAKHNQELSKFTKTLNWKDEYFIPYDYGYFAFIYDINKTKKIPSSFDDLIKNHKGLKIIIQDARSSTPGLGLLLWVKAVYGYKAKDYWQKLSPQILTIAKGWSEAYGLFLKGEADMVLSYTTSPAYHIIAESKNNYKAIYFDEGNYSQIEVAGILNSSQNQGLAKDFLTYFSSSEAQSIIPTTNWMYPVIDNVAKLPKEFVISDELKQTPALAGDDVFKNKSSWIQEWLEATSK